MLTHDSTDQRPGRLPFAVLAIPAILVMVFVASAHWPVLSAQPTSFDDQLYLTENNREPNPGWVSVNRIIREVLKPTVPGYYERLAMISLMLDAAAGPSIFNSFAAPAWPCIW